MAGHLTPPDSRSAAPAARLAAFTLFVLWLEAAATLFWPALTLIGAFLALALFGVQAALPAWLHTCLLFAFGLALAAVTWSGIRRFHRPGRADALRRLERDNRLLHRPFEALTDRPAADNGPAAQALWRMHQERMRAQIRRLRFPFPRPALPDRDPMALRLGVLIALLLAFVIAGPRASRLIEAAFTPDFGASAAPLPVDAWIKPPDYTGLPPILLKAGMDRPIAAPIGSMLEAHVTGGSRTPHLTQGDQRVDFKKMDGGGFGISQVLTMPGTLSIRRGWSSLARWRIEIIPDNAPVVAFVGSPAPAGSGALRIEYRATDDYGVTSVGLKVRFLPNHRPIAGDPIAPVLASGQREKLLRGSSYQDLTSHPWAGMQVLAKLVATDANGQTGESEEVPITLPERAFTHPVARAIIAARKHLILNDVPRAEIMIAVAGLAYRPDAYGDDYAVFLTLRTAASELGRRADDEQTVAEILDLLWNAALKIEDGDRPEADKALRAAEDALEQALKDPNTPASEIARLTQALKDAMNRDIQAAIENLRQRQARGEQIPSLQLDPQTRILTQKDLANEIDRMMQMAENGSRDAAQEMLDRIKSLLENMRSGGEAAQPNEKGEKALKDLKDLAERQRALENGEKDGASAAQDQESLRQALGDTARDIDEAMGNIPGSLSSADHAMRNAARSLQRGSKDGARDDQEKAADQLDEAARSLSEQLSSQGTSVREGDGEASRDPLGRSRSNRGFDKGANVKVPTDREMQRSREILDELRKRAGEHDRPRFELDYIQRLLQQF